MLTGQRVIFSDDGSLKDLSKSLGDIFSPAETLTMIAADDWLYMGADQPFNHRYLRIPVANVNSGDAVVEIWTGSEWAPAVDVIDGTSVGGKTLAKSGILQWVTPRNKGWCREPDSGRIPELATTSVYDMFWTRLRVTADSSAVGISYVGQSFSDDRLLGGYYPDLVRAKMLTSYAAGKTNWDDQHVLAAEELIRDLRKRRYVLSGAQVFDWELFSVPAMHKCATIIMSGLGDAYADRAIDSQESYQNELENTMAGIDRNRDGRLSIEERKPVVGLRRV